MKRKITFDVVLLMLVLFAAIANSGAVKAAEVDVVPEFYVTAMSNYYETAGDPRWFDTYAATAELNFYPMVKPFHGGLFIDFRDSTGAELDQNLNTGGYFRYNLSRWDATTWLFVNRSPDSDPAWIYAARLRYRVTDSYKLGIEALAPFEQADRPKLMLGYYGQLAPTLSLNALAGGRMDGGPDFAARIEFVWQAL